MNPDDDIRTSGGLLLPAAALTWRFDRAGGPGGQHRNKVHTRARVDIDLELLQGPPDVAARVRGRLGRSITLVEGASRSQWRNRMVLVERVAAVLDEAGRPVRERRPTKPGRAAVERRLTEKRRNTERKLGRGPVIPD